ncbi:hypothetical protein GWK47_048832 [Chionoecetes opilio]|uniref:Uncharacterized protein n=1 Tax=Chionoecetes opilio TaxID=41210 RepID=A0A8J5CTN6_CHIOP|nr:hypothetical protein GWK47_048832 [Chionoecetes opilio]
MAGLIPGGGCPLYGEAYADLKGGGQRALSLANAPFRCPGADRFWFSRASPIVHLPSSRTSRPLPLFPMTRRDRADGGARSGVSSAPHHTALPVEDFPAGSVAPTVVRLFPWAFPTPPLCLRVVGLDVFINPFMARMGALTSGSFPPTPGRRSPHPFPLSPVPPSESLVAGILPGCPDGEGVLPSRAQATRFGDSPPCFLSAGPFPPAFLLSAF